MIKVQRSKNGGNDLDLFLSHLILILEYRGGWVVGWDVGGNQKETRVTRCRMGIRLRRQIGARS